MNKPWNKAEVPMGSLFKLENSENTLKIFFSDRLDL